MCVFTQHKLIGGKEGNSKRIDLKLNKCDNALRRAEDVGLSLNYILQRHPLARYHGVGSSTVRARKHRVQNTCLSSLG